MRPRRSLTARGAGALVAAVSCAVTANVVGAPILLYVAVLLLVVTALAAVVVHVPRRTGSVSRQIDSDLLFVGELSHVAVRFELRAVRAPHGLWRDTLPTAVVGSATGEYPPDAPTLSYAISGARRGVWQIGPLLLRTTDPFGLAQREQAFGGRRAVTVVPAIVALTPLAARAGSHGGTARASSSRLGQGSDNLSPRRYASGDSMRRIHWRATAHRGHLMVRQEEEESNPDALVVLDRSARRWMSEDPSFEAAVSLCASAALRLSMDGYTVGVVDSAGAGLGVLSGHEDDRDDLLVALASVFPGGETRELEALLGDAPPGPLIYITGRIDEEDAALLRPTGAAAPLLFATDPLPGAEDAARAHGWSTAALGADIADAWSDAVTAHSGADDATR